MNCFENITPNKVEAKGEVLEKIEKILNLLIHLKINLLVT